MLAVSTAWNADRWDDGRAIAEEIERLGIRCLELNFSLTPKMVDDIAAAARQLHLTFSSLHNYCPAPEGFNRFDAKPDCFSLSALDEDERKRAVELTQRTIATAKKLRARAVVLHTGRVEMEDRTRDMIRLANAGEGETLAFKELRANFVAERRKKSRNFFNQLIRSLESLVPCAEKADIRLGVENRFYYREIPDVEELKTILDRFSSPYIGYWHDVGHGYIFEQLGLTGKEEFLRLCGKRLIGMHLHNVINLDDHQAPMNGDVDMRAFKPYLNDRVLKVIEAHSKVSAPDLMKSVLFVHEVLGADDAGGRRTFLSGIPPQTQKAHRLSAPRTAAPSARGYRLRLAPRGLYLLRQDRCRRALQPDAAGRLRHLGP